MMSATVGSDLDALALLNQTYIDCVVHADTARFAEILADDFLNSNPDGTLVDKTAFLQQIARIGPLQSIELEDVRIRIEANSVALIHAATRYTLADGRTGRGRYTDIWAKRGGRWTAVAAHVTRIISA
jgi:hypothetical protein